MNKFLTIFTFILVFSTAAVKAQCDTIANFCHKNNFTADYISDGQNYRAFLAGTQEAEFETTLFEGTTYRIAACSGFTQGNLLFKIKDEEGNVLFDSIDFGNTGGAKPTKAGDAYFALYTLAMRTGRTRSAYEIATLCHAAGFEGVKTPHARRPFVTSCVEARKP